MADDRHDAEPVGVNLADQPVDGVPLGEVSHESEVGVHDLLELVGVSPAVAGALLCPPVELLQSLEAVGNGSPADVGASRQYHGSCKEHAFGVVLQVALVRMRPEPYASVLPVDERSDVLEPLQVVAEGDAVVHVVPVVGHVPLVAQQVVEVVEIDECRELADDLSDDQSVASVAVEHGLMRRQRFPVAASALADAVELRAVEEYDLEQL